MDFGQHVTQPTHNRRHTLDLIITYGLSTYWLGCLRPLLHLLSLHLQQLAPVRTVGKSYLSSQVAANFIAIFHNTRAEILPAPCNSIVDHFNGRQRSTLVTAAPLSNKTIKNNNSSPWKNDKIRHVKKICRRAERKWKKTKLTVS